MAFKFLAVFALFAVASAGIFPNAQYYHAAAPVAHYAAPLATYAAPAAVVKTVAATPVTHYTTQPVLTKAAEEYDPHPQYKYSYDVQDSLSGDSKSQVEERDGDVVRGEYSLIDADGFKRTVQYTADPINGFNAVVHREPLVKAVAVAAPAIVKTVSSPIAHYAAPTVVKAVAPAYSAYSTPTAYVTHH